MSIKVAPIALALIFSIFGAFSCSPAGSSRPSDSIVVAYSPFEPTALLWIAQDQQYFSKNGLDLTLRRYDTGAASLSAALKGEADTVIGVSEFPVVRMAFQKEKMAIMGSADKGEFIYLIGRRDRGIEKASDLKGKRVGTAVGTIAQFHLGRFLELNAMEMQDITLVDLKTPEEWVNAIVNGDIDAVVTAQPDANTVKERLGANGLFMSAQEGQFLHGLIVSTDRWVITHPEVAERFLRALVQAEDYASRNPAEAKAIVQRGLSLNAGYMDTVWSQNKFALSLDQSLIIAMEDEARWMIDNNFTSEKTVPNFLDYIYAGGLKSVKPGAVRIPGE